MGPYRSPLSRVVVVVVVVVAVVVDIGVRRLAVANGPNIFQMLLVCESYFTTNTGFPADGNAMTVLCVPIGLTTHQKRLLVRLEAYTQTIWKSYEERPPTQVTDALSH